MCLGWSHDLRTIHAGSRLVFESVRGIKIKAYKGIEGFNVASRLFKSVPFYVKKGGENN